MYIFNKMELRVTILLRWRLVIQQVTNYLRKILYLSSCSSGDERVFFFPRLSYYLFFRS